MAAAYDSSGVGAVRPNVPQSDTGAFYRVTVDNVLSFEFPSLAMAEAFAADYGPGCDISREIPPEAAACVSVASGEVPPVDPSGYKLVYHGETIFTDPDEFVCVLLRQKLGVGVVVPIRAGETAGVSDHWRERIEQTLAIRAGRGHWDDGSLPLPPRQVDAMSIEDTHFPALHPLQQQDAATEPITPVFRFDERWLDDECPDDPDDAFTDDPEENDPTPQEIAEACRQIRREWDAKTFRSRAGQMPVTRIARSRFVIGGRR